MTAVSGVFGPVFANATLDENGFGAVQFQAQGQSVTINNISCKVSSNTNEATFTLYRGQIGDAYRHSGSFSGSSGDNNSDIIPLNDGERIIGVWSGGDPGSNATMTVSGTATIGAGGFRAVG